MNRRVGQEGKGAEGSDDEAAASMTARRDVMQSKSQMDGAEQTGIGECLQEQQMTVETGKVVGAGTIEETKRSLLRACLP